MEWRLWRMLGWFQNPANDKNRAQFWKQSTKNCSEATRKPLARPSANFKICSEKYTTVTPIWALISRRQPTVSDTDL